LARQVGDSRALSFIEKEAMAPRSAGGLAGGMALSGHICRKNYEFTSIKGPAPVTARGYDPNLCHRDPGHVARSGHTLGTTSGGSILVFIYLERPGHPFGKPKVHGSQQTRLWNGLDWPYPFGGTTRLIAAKGRRSYSPSVTT